MRAVVCTRVREFASVVGVGEDAVCVSLSLYERVGVRRAQAMKIDPSNATYCCNRAAALLMLEQADVNRDFTRRGEGTMAKGGTKEVDEVARGGALRSPFLKTKKAFRFCCAAASVCLAASSLLPGSECACCGTFLFRVVFVLIRSCLLVSSERGGPRRRADGAEARSAGLAPLTNARNHACNDRSGHACRQMPASTQQHAFSSALQPGVPSKSHPPQSEREMFEILHGAGRP
eukprot:6202210-Pleurochrysis_carterae.AAC.1